MKTRNLSKWLILLLCACVVSLNSCDKSDYEQNNRKEMKKQEDEKKKQEDEKKKQEEEKKKQEEEKKKQEEEEARRKKEEEKQKQLTLDPVSFTLAPIMTKNINVKNGTAPYSVKVVDGKIAIVKVYDNENYIAVTGLGMGTTEIVVTDKNMKTGKVTVTVK
nr:pilus assembly protein N-terminal domain-containing protein [uncultured Prevotella sp.]